MFESDSGVVVDDPVDTQIEDALDWERIERHLHHDEEERTWGTTTPSGPSALEIDTDTQYEAGLADAQLIDAMVGFERLTAWAQARQAHLLAEFARRRPGDDPTLIATDKPCTMSKFAPDEVGLALKLARMTAKAKLGRAVQLEQVLPETLQLWQQGRLDERRVGAICDAAHYLNTEKARAVQQRVLDRAPEQTLAQLQAALRRAVIHVDPEGAAERHRAARRDRRVSVSEEHDGMASLWALLSAPDARSSFQWLTRLAQGCGTDDPRGMDARRADLMVELLTGRLTWAAPDGEPTTGTDSGTAADSEPHSEASTASEDGTVSEGGTASKDDPAVSAEVDTAEVDTAAADHTHSEAATGAGAAGEDGTTSEVPAGAETDTDTDTKIENGARTGTGAAEHDTDVITGTAAHTAASDATDPDATASDADAHARPDGRSGGSGSPPRPVNPGKPLVQVLMPFTALLGKNDQPCKLVGHGSITAELAREIAADATLRRLVYDPVSGTILDYGRTTYRPPAGLADFVRARDMHCRSPICRRRALDGHLDHIVPYPEGPTNDTNLHGCCGHEHQMKHTPGWAVRALPDGRIQWITPTGHRYHSQPFDYRPDEPDDLPPDTAPKRRDLPKDLTRRLERLERDRRSTVLWNGETVPDDDGAPPPF